MAKERKGWNKYWLIATVLAIGGLFAVPETVALVDPSEGDTYTESIRLWIGDNKEWFLAAWAAFAVWFPYHILSGKKEDFHTEEELEEMEENGE